MLRPMAAGQIENEYMRDDQRNEFAEALLAWFRGHARVLPWREDASPYRVWISEIMLQQTRVAAVMPYFLRFMEALPDVAALAAVDDDKLMKLWEGLGYYSRARNLKKAAGVIMDQYHGVIPAEYSELCRLPGIGPYTAGAIASIAYGQEETAVDGNVLRVFSRLNAVDGVVTEPPVREKITKSVRECLPKAQSGVYNQSLMELGALICLPNGEPKCGECPVRAFCKAYEQGNMLEYPRKPAKKARTIERMTVLILQDENYLAIRRRPETGLLAGLYEFPSLSGHCSEEEVLASVRSMGFAPIHIRRLPEAKHIFTHKEWHMIGYAVRVDEFAEREAVSAKQNLIFVEPEKTEREFPIPAAFEAYAEYYHIRLGNSRFVKGE